MHLICVFDPVVP